MKAGTFVYLLFFMLVCAGSLAAQEWTTYTTENSGLAGDEVHTICVDGNGVRWFGTNNGLSSFTGTTWKTYTTDDKLAHNMVNAIAFEVTDYEPEIWVGTNDGVSVVSVVPDAITFATPYRSDNTGLISNIVYTAVVDTGHVKWFGTDSGVSSFDGQNWEVFTTENFLSHNRVMSIDRADDGWIYFGTEGGGVSRFDGVSSASPYDTDWSGIASDNVYAVYIDADGVKWFGTDEGLSAHVGDDTRSGWTTYTAEDGLANNFVYTVAEDRDGVKWFGTGSGVSSFDGTTWHTYTTQDGLAGNTIYAIAVDGDGSLWFGTDSGVSRFGVGPVLVEKTEDMPTAPAINGCFPNPFNPQTTIMFTLPSDGLVKLTVYNIAGQKVRHLVSDTMTAGVHTAIWDGCDDSGEKVSSGVYISYLKMGAHSVANRMLLVK